MALVLGAIRGSFSGTPGQSLQTVPIGQEKSIRWNIDELSTEVKRQVAQLNHATSPSLQVSPQETQFARVATWVSFKTKHPVTLGVGFIDSETGETLTLMYFDQPCRLTGTSVSGANGK